MRTRELTLVFAIIVIFMIACIGNVYAARTIPASNETSTLVVEISASAKGDLRSNADVVFQQGNGNLSDNPPLDQTGEGVNTVGYFENTMATDGSIQYDQTIRLDTGNKVAPQNNLETTRVIDYTNEDDGGRMYSSEEVLVSSTSSAADTDGTGCCAWGAAAEGDILPATCTDIIAGSEMDITEGSVSSSSSGRTVASSTDEPVSLEYSVNLEGSNQTANEDAEGMASVHVDANIQEGGGADGTDKATDVDHEQEVSVTGMINLAMKVSYSTD